MKEYKLVGIVLFVFIIVFTYTFILIVSDSMPITGRYSATPGRGLDYRCPDCNVILISIDTLRADHLGCYGYHRDTSPNIDRLASESILFENTFSNSHWTLPSHMSIMTSQYPSVHNVNNYFSVERNVYFQTLEESKTTLAEVLKKSGYTTIAFTGGGNVAPEFGFDQGFDSYSVIETYYRNTELLNNISEWLDNNHNKKFFMFVHTFSVHSPYIPPKSFKCFFDSNYSGDIIDSYDKIMTVLSENPDFTPTDLFKDAINTSDPRDIYHTIALYDDGIRYTDYSMGILLDKIKSLGLDRNTVIVFTSDHGEDLMDHGVIADHTDLYDEQIHVPLIIHFPNKILERIKSLAQSIDIMPTTLAILNILPPEGMQGKSLIPHQETDNRIFSERSFSCYFRYRFLMAWYYDNKVYCEPLSRDYVWNHVCLGLFNISLCDELSGELNRRCRMAYHLKEENNYTLGSINSYILESIINNKTVSETCNKLHNVEFLTGSETFHDISVRNKEFKYIYRFLRKDELYDIINDPDEQTNIIDERPGVAEKMRNELFEIWEQNREFALKENLGTEQSKTQLANETLEILKGLGYL